MISLSDTSTQNKQWELTSKPSDPESSSLFTQSHALMQASPNKQCADLHEIEINVDGYRWLWIHLHK